MSPYTRTTRRGNVRPTRYRAVQWPMVLWLALLWWVLWGSYSLLSLVGGVVVAVLVCFVLPLPPLRMSVRVRPVAVVVLVARFLGDVVLASLQVAWITVVPPRPLRNAIVRVPLRSESDFVQVVVAELLSLVPGSVVVEAHRASHTLYLHVIDVRDERDVDRFRERVWAQERRVVRAFGAELLPEPPEVTTS